MTAGMGIPKTSLEAYVAPAGSLPALPAPAWGVRLLTLGIRAYQLSFSPAQVFLFGPTIGCRHTPSCSAYAMEALQTHGIWAGTRLTVRRLGRCHPWGSSGHDPVPPSPRPAAGEAGAAVRQPQA